MTILGISRHNAICITATDNLSMISTNSNDKVSTAIADIYEKYGFGVELSVSISNTKNDQIKIYDIVS